MLANTSIALLSLYVSLDNAPPPVYNHQCWHDADPCLPTRDGLAFHPPVSEPLVTQEIKLNSSNASLASSPRRLKQTNQPKHSHLPEGKATSTTTRHGGAWAVRWIDRQFSEGFPIARNGLAHRHAEGCSLTGRFLQQQKSQRLVAGRGCMWGNEQNDAQSTVSLWMGGMFPKISWQQGTIQFCNHWYAYGQSHVARKIKLGGEGSTITSIIKKAQKRQTPLERPLQQAPGGSPGLSHTDTAAPAGIMFPTT